MDKLIVGLFGFALILVFVFLFALLGAIITQWAWANSVAEVFHLADLTFWQAFWLNVLGGMLCKSSSVSSK